MKTSIAIISVLLLAIPCLSIGGSQPVNVSGPKVGGPTDFLDHFDLNDKANKQILELVTQEIEKTFELEGYEFNKIESLTVQIVAGKRFDFGVSYKQTGTEELRYFTASIWVKPWENFAQVTKVTEVPQIELAQAPVIVGGPKTRDFDLENNASDVKVYERAVEEIEKTQQLISNGFKVVAQSQVETQIVAGTIYIFDLTFGTDETEFTRTFRFKIILVPWENRCEIINVQEIAKGQSHPSVGGARPYKFDIESNPFDKLIFAAVNAEVARKEMELGNEFSNFLEQAEFRNATAQLVYGTVYNFDIVYTTIAGEQVVYSCTVYMIPNENQLEVQKCERK